MGNPKHIDLPIPGNASGTASIGLVMGKIAEAIKVGQKTLNAAQKASQQPVVKKTWDPWLFSLDRYRRLRRRSLRQPWHIQQYGSYEGYQKAHPYGKVNAMVPYKKFDWGF